MSREAVVAREALALTDVTLAGNAERAGAADGAFEDRASRDTGALAGRDLEGPTERAGVAAKNVFDGGGDVDVAGDGISGMSSSSSESSSSSSCMATRRSSSQDPPSAPSYSHT